jgi:hypothetical protein
MFDLSEVMCDFDAFAAAPPRPKSPPTLTCNISSTIATILLLNKGNVQYPNVGHPIIHQ